ncbi:MAG: hypothetical protein LUG21_08685 [Clostridiales bacterium]|nr:hypothetical protein [Clostridiales bacterium]
MALPFKLFNTLSQTQMRIILAAEIIIYFSLFAVFCLKKEQNAKRKKKDAEAKNQRKKRIENYQSALKELSVTDYENAA